MSRTGTDRRSPRTRWGADLALGVRLSIAGGRSGWFRLVLIATGVGLGVAMLLAVASIPTVVAGREARLAARQLDVVQSAAPGDATLLVAMADTQYRQQRIVARLVQADGDTAPLPPGVHRLPAPGEMVVSPALERLLTSPEGDLLRPRWDAQVVGTIDAEGLAGPGELVAYVGTDGLTEDSAIRVASFGRSHPPGQEMYIGLLMLAVVGLAVGGLLFAGVGLAAARFVPAGLSFPLADFRPAPALAVLVVVLVPVSAVLVTVSALRRVVIEPLGVVRQNTTRRRRLWWRLLLPAAGVALLATLREGSYDDRHQLQLFAGVAALLVGVALLLPWLVQATVRRLGGGSVAWELAVRRLQLDDGTAVRVVSGIAVSVAGVIALQGLLVAVQTQYSGEAGADTAAFQAEVLPGSTDPDQPWDSTLAQAPGVVDVTALTTIAARSAAEGAEESAWVKVADCAVLRQLATVDTCADGDAFVVTDLLVPPARPGQSYELGEPGTEPVSWRVPEQVKSVTFRPQAGPQPVAVPTILATPAALGHQQPAPLSRYYWVALDPTDPDALERLRNTITQWDPTASVVDTRFSPAEATLATVYQVLLVGAVALLLLIGASMLVNVAEQLQQRRRLLAVLVAFGTRRSALAGSVLYQVAIPVLLGLALAVATGTGLAAILQTAADSPVRLDWSGIGTTSTTAALVVLATTAASLPLLWRLTRPGGLRSE